MFLHLPLVRVFPFVITLANVWLIPGAFAQTVDRIEVRRSATDEQRQWIGVRISAVPESLAAHVGANGVMVLNVAEGSPADAAGLQRYDVLREVNSRSVSDVSELAGAINLESGPVELLVLREGKHERVTITPTASPNWRESAWKYEQTQPLVEDSLNMRGMFLRKDADGEWSMGDLGEIESLPDVFKDLQFDFSFDFGEDKPFTWEMDLGAGGKREIRIEIDRDGATLEIVRDEEGVISVSRVDPDGNVDVQAYGSAEALEAGDPEAYAEYERLAKPRRRFLLRRPDGEELIERRSQLESSIQRQMAEIREQARQAQAHAEEAIERFRVEVRERAGDEPGAFFWHSDSEVEQELDAIRTPDGPVFLDALRVEQIGETFRVTRTTSSGKMIYEFNDEDAFASELPKVYERYAASKNQP